MTQTTEGVSNLSSGY